MPLNLSVNDGDFTPYLKYNAKAGRFYARPDGGKEDVEIVAPVLAFDMANIKTGWIFYAEGIGPEKVWDPSSSQTAPKPRDQRKWKRGFEVMVYGNGLIPGTSEKLGLREFSSTAGNVIAAILTMHAAYEAQMAANRDSVPIFVCDRVKPVAGTYGTNYEPVFTLKGWVPRSRVPDFDKALAQPEHPQSNGSGGFSELNPPPSEDIPF